jgi:hypothetical protein
VSIFMDVVIHIVDYVRMNGMYAPRSIAPLLRGGCDCCNWMLRRDKRKKMTATMCPKKSDKKGRVRVSTHSIIHSFIYE